MRTSWYYWYEFLVLGIHGFEFMVFMVRIYGGVLKKRILLGTSGTISVCIRRPPGRLKLDCSGSGDETELLGSGLLGLLGLDCSEN